jgi:sugar phosphate isomerase/epimerase
VGPEANSATIAAYAAAARQSDIVIAEVGAWSNPLSPDERTREAATIKAKQSLALADEIGACCCVNISGSRGAVWDGPDPRNLTNETFEMIVASVREIIDAVEPVRTFYTLEPMPWMYPDSPDSYLQLIAAIDRPSFRVHLDIANMINSPSRYLRSNAFIRECVQKLGPYIKSCHAKDVALGTTLTTHLAEVRPGLGGLDYAAILRALDGLDSDTPLMLEHLPNQREYQQAADHVRAVARDIGVDL